jgi:hypothetical protein
MNSLVPDMSAIDAAFTSSLGSIDSGVLMPLASRGLG